jgi:hypothetical protein
MVLRITVSVSSKRRGRIQWQYWVFASCVALVFVVISHQILPFQPYTDVVNKLISDAPTRLFQGSLTHTGASTGRSRSSGALVEPEKDPDPVDCVHFQEESNQNQNQNQNQNLTDTRTTYEHTKKSINARVDSKLTRFLLNGNRFDAIDNILGQTMCHEKGRFRTLPKINDDWDPNDEQLVADWEIKLLYLAIHDLFHEPARDEFQQRCDQANTPYHFTCPTAKYLVTALPVMGMGAVFRLSTISHVAMAIVSGRIPVFVANTVDVGPYYIKAPWPLASCQRRDFQCVFLPTTPCHLDISDLANATIMEEGSCIQLRRRGVMPKEFDNDRIVIVQSRINSAKIESFKGMNRVIRRTLYNKAQSLIDDWRSSDSNSNKLEVLRKAANMILDPDSFQLDRFHYGYRYETNSIHVTEALQALRRRNLNFKCPASLLFLPADILYLFYVD